MGVKGENQVNRNSEDKHKNSRGEELLDVCKLNNLLIANGRKPGDLFGKFTCHNWNGSSVVDYVIFSECLNNVVVRFLVGSYIPWLSDHCTVGASLVCGDTSGVRREDSIAGESLHPGFVWSDESIDAYKKGLRKLCNEVKVGALLNSSVLSPSQLAGGIRDLLWCNAEISGLREKKRGPSGGGSQPWFDKECSDCKGGLSRLGKELARNPGDRAVRASVLDAQRNFRKIALAKKRRYRRGLVADLEEKHSRGRAREFWRNLRKISPKSKSDAVQPSMSECVNHFKTISNSNMPQVVPEPSGGSVRLTFWCLCRSCWGRAKSWSGERLLVLIILVMK